jgi:hypothetical protein
MTEPTTPVTTIASKLTADLAWLRTHLIMLVIVVGLAWGGIYGVESLMAKHDAAQEAKYSQILAAQTAQTTAIENKLTTDEANWNQIASQLTAQNMQLAQQVASRDAQITVLMNKISTMTVPQVAADLQPKLHAGTATVQPNGVLLDVNAARDVDEQITKANEVLADLTDVKQQLANEVVLYTNASADARETHTALAAEQVKNADQIKACAIEVKQVKDDARKSKTKWAIFSAIGGFVLHFVLFK